MAQRHRVFSGRLQQLDDGIRRGGTGYDDEPDAHVEGAEHFRGRDSSPLL